MKGKKNKMKNKFIKLLLLFTLIAPITFSAANTASDTVYAQTDTKITNITPRRPIITYRYKLVKGILYRRKYDATNDRWLGPWERA